MYKYALTVVDVASRYKAAEPLTSKESGEVARGFIKIYKSTPLKWPKILQVDPGSEFKGVVNKEMERHGVRIRRGNVNVHRDQGIVERFNRSLGEKLIGIQYGKEIDSKGKFSTRNRYNKWVKILPEVVKSLNGEVTRMIGKKPINAVKEDVVKREEMKYKRPVGLREKRLDSDVKVRFLYADGELEGGVRRATDPDWSLKVYNIDRVVVDEGEPVLYYLKSDSVKRGFVREELMVVPVGTELPP